MFSKNYFHVYGFAVFFIALALLVGLANDSAFRLTERFFQETQETAQAVHKGYRSVQAVADGDWGSSDKALAPAAFYLPAALLFSVNERLQNARTDMRRR